MVRVTRRLYDQMTKVPAKFLGELNEHGALTYQVWASARAENNFSKVRPNLEKTLDLSRQMANYFPGYDHIIDPLVSFSDYGMDESSLTKLFTELRSELAPIVQAITSQPPADDSCLRKNYPQYMQLAIGREIAPIIGYDIERGRIDLTHHPFETNFSVGDVRITTRVKDNLFSECFYSIIHESGHAMYEQGIRPELDGSPLGGGTSSGAHESSSRLWENLVGRSREFCEFFYPRIRKSFPNQLLQVSVDEFYRAINKVEQSYIRTDADEVTYNLHVMLRFNLEKELLEGSLEVKDLPEAWNERFKQDIGIYPNDDKDGCLQDVHWYSGVIGGSFQGYTLGNILSAIFFNAALKAHPEIPDEIRSGKFSTLLTWLQENFYQHGSKFTSAELVERVSGGPITIKPYIEYLKNKYGELYNI